MQKFVLLEVRRGKLHRGNAEPLTSADHQTSRHEKEKAKTLLLEIKGSRSAPTWPTARSYKKSELNQDTTYLSRLSENRLSL